MATPRCGWGKPERGKQCEKKGGKDLVGKRAKGKRIRMENIGVEKTKWGKDIGEKGPR